MNRTKKILKEVLKGIPVIFFAKLIISRMNT